MAIALVASVSSGSTNSAAFTTAAIDTTGATSLVACIAYFSVGGTLSDSKGNTWTARPAQTQGSDGVRLYYCLSPTVGTGHTFSSTGTYSTISVLAFSGGALTFVASGGAIASSPGTITPSSGGHVIVAAAERQATGIAVDSGFSAITTDNAPGAHVGGGLAYLIQGAAAAVTPTWSGTGGAGFASVYADFAGPSPAGGPFPFHLLSSQSGGANRMGGGL